MNIQQIRIIMLGSLLMEKRGHVNNDENLSFNIGDALEVVNIYVNKYVDHKPSRYRAIKREWLNLKSIIVVNGSLEEAEAELKNAINPILEYLDSMDKSEVQELARVDISELEQLLD